MSWLYEPENRHDLDEDDVRVRPNPKGSRPRTKRRPSFENAPRGMVTQVHLARYKVITDKGVEVTATLAKELRKDGCVTCDRVALDGDVTGAKGSLARIVTIDERSSVLTRAAEDGEELEQTIVANADQLVIVMAAANPEPRPRLVDRYLVAAYNAGLKPILVVTKCDVSDPADFIAGFAGVELEIIQTRSDQPLPQRLLDALVDHTSVFVGHSGVGKSTLINKLAPNTDRSTGIVNELTGKGKHTSSSAIAIKVSGGWIVDTPGIRSFGLSGISAGQILRGFSDLSDAAEACPRDCSHMPPADDCALDQALREGKLTELRLDSFRRLVAGLGSVDWQ